MEILPTTRRYSFTQRSLSPVPHASSHRLHPSPPTSSSMAMKISRLLFTLLWLSLIFLFLHYLNNAKPFFNTYHRWHAGTTRYPSSLHHGVSINRKILASKFDFSPFQTRNLHWQDHREGVSGDQAEGEIDLRYGVENRLVPTGPNPLHH